MVDAPDVLSAGIRHGFMPVAVIVMGVPVVMAVVGVATARTVRVSMLVVFVGWVIVQHGGIRNRRRR
jgi:hypothetical protein